MLIAGYHRHLSVIAVILRAKNYFFGALIQFCRQSRGSVSELIDDFNECFDENYVNEAYCYKLKEEAYTLIKVLNSYIASIKRQKEKYAMTQ